MKDIIFDNFQNCVSDSLVRHKSILDSITKYTESSARVNRSIAKAVTNCGCININAKKQNIPDEEYSIEEFKNCMKSHINGELCDSCRGIIEKEIGNNIFYLTSLCNQLDLNLFDIVIKEYNNINTLGKFSLR